jgi:NAD(P)-dependent dehydrogenase (short-subunit alcohol dehydrogenase family)
MIKEKRKTVLITGAGRGFGFALTKNFILNQWNVFALVRNKKDAMNLMKIGETQCFPILSDITSNTVKTSIQEALMPFGKIDVLINNAGIGGNSAILTETTAAEVLSLIDVHCLGALRVSQAVLPYMNKEGTIVNISSRFGSITKISTGQLDHISCSYSYRIAKAAQNMLTQCMCREFKDTELKVCSIHPGRLKTDTASVDADKTPEEAAEVLFEKLKSVEHGKFYSLFEGTIEW